jgi:hypothetical protein
MLELLSVLVVSSMAGITMVLAQAAWDNQRSVVIAMDDGTDMEVQPVVRSLYTTFLVYIQYCLV